MDSTQQYLKPTDAAKLMGVSHQTVTNLISRGVLTAKKVGGVFYINKTDLETVMPQATDFDTLAKRIEKAKEEMRQEAEETEQKLKEQKQKSWEKMHSFINYYSILDFLRSSRWERETVKEFLKKLGWQYLTTREFKVLAELCDGKSIQMVADAHGLTAYSIQNIFHKAMEKMEAAPNVSDMLLDYEEAKQMCEMFSKQYAEALNTIAELRRQLDPKKKLESQQKKKALPEEAKNMMMLLNTHLIDLDVSCRCMNCMKAADIETLGDLVQYDRTSLLKFRNFGKKTLAELDDLLDSLNLEWGMDLKPYAEAIAIMKDNN